MSRIFAIALIHLSVVAVPIEAAPRGDVHPWLDSTYSLEFGIFYPERALKLRAAGRIDIIPDPEEFIDFGSQLRISQSDRTFAAEFGWRYGKRWSLRVQYFDSKGSNTALLEEDIAWEDLVFLEGTRATAGTEFELSRFVWDYTVDDHPNYDIGLSVGFHWLHIRGFIEGTIETPTGPSFGADSASVDAPLPNIGFTYMHSLSPRWAFRTRLDWFSADIDPYDGIFINASAGFNFQATDRLGIGFNYNYVDLDVGLNASNWRGEIETRYDGVYVYLGAVW